MQPALCHGQHEHERVYVLVRHENEGLGGSCGAQKSFSVEETSPLLLVILRLHGKGKASLLVLRNGLQYLMGSFNNWVDEVV